MFGKFIFLFLSTNNFVYPGEFIEVALEKFFKEIRRQKLKKKKLELDPGEVFGKNPRETQNKVNKDKCLFLRSLAQFKTNVINVMVAQMV